jgi:hypothetical protein
VVVIPADHVDPSIAFQRERIGDPSGLDAWQALDGLQQPINKLGPLLGILVSRRREIQFDGEYVLGPEVLLDAENADQAPDQKSRGNQKSGTERNLGGD